MRVDLKEKNHFLTVFEAFFDQSINRPINGISIDSRNIKKNDLFIAIKGEYCDGNDFVDQALQDGASFVVIGRELIESKKPLDLLKEYGEQNKNKNLWTK